MRLVFLGQEVACFLLKTGNCKLGVLHILQCTADLVLEEANSKAAPNVLIISGASVEM